MHSRLNRYKPVLWLLPLTAAAIVVEGYHPFVEDAEIYLPGVEKLLNPKLFPSGQEFFQSHASMTLFPNLLATFFRITHLPFSTGLFLGQLASIYLLLLACWQLSRLFFESTPSRWGGVCLVAALLSIPVAGTALYLDDQYLNPRNLAAFASVFALARLLEKKYLRMLLWLAFAASVHPLMWVFPASFCLLFVVMEKVPWLRAKENATAVAALILVFPFSTGNSAAYHLAALKHSYFYVQEWAWYELVGAVAPLVLFAIFIRLARKGQWLNLARVSRAFIFYGLIYLAMAIAFDLPPRLETLARLQPLRCFHLLYTVMFVMIGGFLGEFVLQRHLWRWLVLFVPLAAGMFYSQLDLFPASQHIELPGMAPRNPWAQAFLWIRANTPEDALFAMDPDYMRLTGEDEIGFRCLAQRSRLADSVKDNGVVSMFPPLAEEWWTQVQDQSPWSAMKAKDMFSLKNKYGVSWVILAGDSASGFDCKYSNGKVSVCRIP